MKIDFESKFSMCTSSKGKILFRWKHSESGTKIITWQSIVAGIQTFKRGYIWRVGDGMSIDIWKAPWIPSSPDRKVTSERGGSILTRVWDQDLLNSIFNQLDVQRILQIPLAYNSFDDFIA
jgi:hypothetical protein